MTDATKLFKGAAALRKGIAMFAWLGDVEAALKEVPELEKTLESLHAQCKKASDNLDAIYKDVKILEGEHTGAKAQAKELLESAHRQADTLMEEAAAEMAVKQDAADIELAALLEKIETDGASHNALLSRYAKTRDTLKEQVDELNAELAAIKARL